MDEKEKLLKAFYETNAYQNMTKLAFKKNL
jgi:hypothetical protein